MAASEVTAHSIEPVTMDPPPHQPATCDVRIAPAQTVCAWELARQATEDGTREQVLHGTKRRVNKQSKRSKNTGV